MFPDPVLHFSKKGIERFATGFVRLLGHSVPVAEIERLKLLEHFPSFARAGPEKLPTANGPLGG